MHLKQEQKSPVSALISSILSVKTHIMSKRNSEVFFAKGVVCSKVMRNILTVMNKPLSKPLYKLGTTELGNKQHQIIVIWYMTFSDEFGG